VAYPARREKFETPANLRAETEIVSEIRKASGLFFVKLPPMYHVEGVLLQTAASRGEAPRDPVAILELGGPGDVVTVDAVVEVKERHILPRDLSSVILSVEKVIRGTELAGFLRVPFFFAVRFADRAIRVAEIQYGPRWTTGIGGRRVDRDGYDREIVVHVPMGEFLPLDEWAAPESSLP